MTRGMTKNLPPLELVPPGGLRDRLVDAVVRGAKSATSRLRIMDELQGVRVEPPGTRMRLVDSAGGTAAIVEITEVREIRLDEVDDDVAHAEGDWFADAAQWRAAHERYWTRLAADLRARGGSGFEFDPRSLVVVRFFRVV